mmetsp:Transcript_45390/g.105307  ORF Transcript_45390/g.105307 Transcript_45390/m.105307 type:complete len:348 (-) Transcript_45390:233-1276(-)
MAVAYQGAALVGALVSASLMCHAVGHAVSKIHPVLASNITLAFILGLRHAVDCDHLAAIDNVTRQLLRCGMKPISVGCWFALGHSTIVWLLCIVISLGYKAAMEGVSGSLATQASIVAGLCSAGLILAVGLMNAQVAMQLLHTLHGLRQETKIEQAEALETQGQAEFQSALSSIPCLRQVFAMVNRPEKMYFVGFLFGLSFDTATQVGLLGMAAMTGAHEPVPVWMISLIPGAFSCGMCLVDTVNGLLMLATYSWAEVDPMQKLIFNLVVTSLSSVIAVSISGLEVLQMVADQTNMNGTMWNIIRNVNMAYVGYGMICSFMLLFLTSLCGSLCKQRRTSLAAEPLLG